MKHWIFIVAFALTLASCTTVRYVPTETVRDRWHSTARTDTVIERDSTVIILGGDTIRELRWRDRWRTHTVHDTIATHDTIPEPYPVPAQLTPWQQTKVNYGGYALALLAAAILLLILRYRRP